MSENLSMSPAADSKREELNALIALKKGKGEPNRREAKQFTDAWVALTNTVGVNDETVGLLYDGFQFAAGEPLYRYVSESKSKIAYISLFSAKPTVDNDQGIAFKTAINLFALELPEPTSLEAACTIAHSIPKLSVNREGKAFGTLGRSIGKILIKPLVKEKINSEIRLPRKDASAVLSILRAPVEAFAKNPKVKSVEVNAALSLLAWLEEQARDAKGASPVHEQHSAQTEGFAKSTTTPSTSSRKELPAKPAPRDVAERPVRVSKMEPMSGAKEGASAAQQVSDKSAITSNGDEAPSSTQPRKHGMPEVIAFLAAYQSEFEELKARYDRVQAGRRDALNQISMLEQQFRSTKRENAELKERVASLASRCSELQFELSSQKESNKSLNANLKAAETMLSTIDKRDTRQADESTRRLARELGVEYMDFLDAADLPMSVDLGENMRDQLRSVFQIIKANGIEL